MMSSDTTNSPPSEIWQTIVDASKLILTSCKLVAEAVGKVSDPDALYSATDQAESRAASLVDITRTQSLSQQWPVVQKYLYEASITTSNAVADLTRSAKAALSNPYDFLTTQAVGNSTREVADSIKSLIQAAEPLKRPLSLSSSGGGSNSNSSSAVFNPNLPNTTATQASTSHSTAIAALNTTNQQSAVELPNTEIGNKVKTLLTSITTLQTAVVGTHEANFVDAAQKFASAFTAVYTISRSLQIKIVSDNFRDAGTTTLSLAKVVFRSREDLKQKERFDFAASTLTEAAKTIAFSIGQFSTAEQTTNSFSSSQGNHSTTTNTNVEITPPVASVPAGFAYPQTRQTRSGSLPPSSTEGVESQTQNGVPNSPSPINNTSTPKLPGTPTKPPSDESITRERESLREEHEKLERQLKEAEQLKAQLVSKEAQIAKLNAEAEAKLSQAKEREEKIKSLKIPSIPSIPSTASPTPDSDKESKKEDKEKKRHHASKDKHHHSKKASSTGQEDDSSARSTSSNNNPTSLVQRSKAIITLLSEKFPGFQNDWNSAQTDVRDHAIAEILKMFMDASEASSATTTLSRPETPETTSENPQSSTPTIHLTQSVPASTMLAASRAAATAAAALAASKSNNTLPPSTTTSTTEMGSPQVSRVASFTSTERRVTKDMKNMLLLKGPALDFSEWQQMMTKLKLSKRFSSVDEEVSLSSMKEEEKRKMEDRESTFERVIEAASALSTGLVETLVAVTASVAQPSDEVLHKAAKSSMMGLRDQLKLLMTVVRIKISKEVETEDLPTIERISKDSEAEIGRADLTGRVDTAVFAAASAAGHAQQLIVSDIERSIHSTSNSLRLLLTQLLSISGSLQGAGFTTSSSNLIETSATAIALIRSLCELADLVETARTLKIGAEPTLKTGGQLLPSAVTSGDDEDEAKLWDELLDTKAPRQYVIDEQNTPRCATLNKLIEMLTSPTYYNNNFLRTFVVTSSSFTTPSKLLDKLLERYDVPRNRIEERERKMIQMRVAVLIKYWVETQFHEFDDTTISRLSQFVEQTLKRDASELGKLLRAEIDRKTAERQRKIRSMLVPPTDVYVPDEKRSPAAFFAAFDEAEIARQLTIIDSRIFCSIEAKELLDQAWNRPKLQHRSPNVKHMINRANKISFWVSHLVLCCNSHEERVAIVSKVIRIAETVRSLNNYHTLMGLIAGLNLSAVSRLSKTFADIDPKLIKVSKELEKLMSPTSSFKQYRAVTQQSSSATIPYIGVYLSDLTFIDEGNQDKINGMINFEKRELIHRVIADLQHYQHTKHKFPAIEPLFTFLSELPACSEKDLYELSLQREPRDPHHLTQSDRRISITGIKPTKDESKVGKGTIRGKK